MPMYLIERDVPGAHALTPEQQAEISTKSCSVLNGMGPKIKWLQSYTTENKITCIYEADNEDLIREHGAKGGFPVTSINLISGVLSPSLAKS
jgi:hypothetical protein